MTFNLRAGTDFSSPATIALRITLFTTTAGMEIPLGDETCTVIVPAVCKKGDVNGDGNVNISDVTTLINYLLSGDASSVQLGNADINSDGGINISDVTVLINKLLRGED